MRFRPPPAVARRTDAFPIHDKTAVQALPARVLSASRHSTYPSEDLTIPAIADGKPTLAPQVGQFGRLSGKVVPQIQRFGELLHHRQMDEQLFSFVQLNVPIR